MRVGDRVQRRPVTFQITDDNDQAVHHPVWGVVVYIHPAGRFHTVAFECAGGAVVESFQGV